MDSVGFLLQEIRKRPGIYLGVKSLSALGRFMNGYTFRVSAETWMKKTGLDFTANYDDFNNSLHLTRDSDSFDWSEFDQFIFAHYNVEMGAKNSQRIILENSQSEDEAFDKFYELLDLYLDVQRTRIE